MCSSVAVILMGSTRRMSAMPAASRVGARFLAKDSQSDSVLETTAKILEQGGVVALPTDTVYGLVTLQRFAHKLFQIKKRDLSKPVGLFVKDADEVFMVAERTVNDQLLHKLLPGRVTLLLKRLPSFELSCPSTNGLVGVRVPACKFVQDLCARLAEPLAQTSANLSGEPSSVQPTDFEDLWESLDLVVTDTTANLDMGTRTGSTIIDLSRPGKYTIIRDGCVRAEVEQLLEEEGLLAEECT